MLATGKSKPWNSRALSSMQDTMASLSSSADFEVRTLLSTICPLESTTEELVKFPWLYTSLATSTARRLLATQQPGGMDRGHRTFQLVSERAHQA